MGVSVYRYLLAGMLGGMAEKNKGGRPRLAEPLTETVCTKFSEREAAALDELLSGMGLSRSAGLRALALRSVELGPERVVERREPAGGGGPAIPQTVFRPLPPGMEPEMAE